MLLTDDLFLQYLRCYRRAFLEVYGDPGQREAPGDYLNKIIADSSAHRKRILQDYAYVSPEYDRDDLRAGAAATERLMAQGVDCIYRGILLSPGAGGITLDPNLEYVARPDLLVRQPGRSKWGDWEYEPAQIKLGRRPKLEYQLIATFNVWVLSDVQGNLPEATWLILRDRDPFDVHWEERIDPMLELLDGCGQVLIQQQEPEIFIARNRCGLCDWQTFCHGIATEQRHLSLLPGVTPKRYVYLQELGITTLETLRQTKPKLLENLPGFGPDVAQKMIDQAQSSWSDRALLPRLIPLPPVMRSPLELYFDIEAEPDLGVAFLLGVLVVDHRLGTEVFHAFVAEQPDEEQRCWEDFFRFVSEVHPDAPIYHFCSYEVDTMWRLGRLYGAETEQIESLVARFVDIHAWVTQTVTMPVESYALKHIARWVGFDWRDGDANGAMAIFWYVEWLKTGDRTHLDRIVTYNEDDCRATYVVKEWLADFVWGLGPDVAKAELTA